MNPSGKANFIIMAVVVMALMVFIYGALQVNDQKRQIAQLITDQSPLVFEFERLGPNQMTFILDCTRDSATRRYFCKPINSIPPTPTPTPTP